MHKVKRFFTVLFDGPNAGQTRIVVSNCLKTNEKRYVPEFYRAWGWHRYILSPELEHNSGFESEEACRVFLEKPVKVPANLDNYTYFHFSP